MTDKILQAKINLETAQIHWHELARYFAGGHAVHIAPELDLTEVATHMAADNAAYIKTLMDKNQLAPIDDDTAKQWQQTNPLLWAVVIKPWVLVQHKPVV
ncbi:MAG TPA: DUF2288 domain-containing protein [Cellvibrionaceae bacterium]